MTCRSDRHQDGQAFYKRAFDFFVMLILGVTPRLTVELLPLQYYQSCNVCWLFAVYRDEASVAGKRLHEANLLPV
jgi:hypothetical protein